LLRRGIVRERVAGDGADFDFVHARLRQAAYEATTLARRRLLHRRVAELLSTPSTGSDPARLVMLATHQRAAGQDADAAATFREAGLAARALHANREAATHLETALALGNPDVAVIQVALGEVRASLGDYTGAIAALEGAAGLLPGTDLPGVDVRLGRIHLRRGDLVAAASYLDTAIVALEQKPDMDPAATRLLTQALVERAATAERAGDLDRAASAAERALDVVKAGGDTTGNAAAHRILGLVARDRGDLGAARVSLRRSLAMAEADSEAGASIAAGNALALVEAAAGDRDAAIALLEITLEACRRTGERHLEAAVENNLADQLHAMGRDEEAMEHLKRAVATFAEVGDAGELEPEIWKLVTW
jgi:tetratricopeptide (TPR) repeat protein